MIRKQEPEFGKDSFRWEEIKDETRPVWCAAIVPSNVIIKTARDSDIILFGLKDLQADKIIHLTRFLILRSTQKPKLNNQDFGLSPHIQPILEKELVDRNIRSPLILYYSEDRACFTFKWLILIDANGNFLLDVLNERDIRVHGKTLSQLQKEFHKDLLSAFSKSRSYRKLSDFDKFKDRFQKRYNQKRWWRRIWKRNKSSKTRTLKLVGIPDYPFPKPWDRWSKK